MEVQAQTVTMITAAVDETALAADSMSLDHRRHPLRYRAGRQGHRQVEQGFGRFSTRIADFRSATSEFVSTFAA